MIFSLHKRTIARIRSARPDATIPKHLAYVQWFTPFPNTIDDAHFMYRIRHAVKDGQRVATIVPVSTIRRSVHLIPEFGAEIPSHWTTDNVLDECPAFFVNSFTDKHTYMTVY